MIKPINLFNINSINFSANVQNQPRAQALPCDSVEISNSTKFKQNYKQAKINIIKTLKKEGVEELYVLAPDGEIITEKKGNTHQVNVRGRFPQNCTVLHGHPIQNSPLSPKDVASLLSTPTIKEITAFDQKGRFSTLTKNGEIKKRKYKTVVKEMIEDYKQRVSLDLGLVYKNKWARNNFFESNFAIKFESTPRIGKIKEEMLKDFAKENNLTYSSNLFTRGLAPKSDFFNWANETNFMHLLLPSSICDENLLGKTQDGYFYNIIGNENYILKLKDEPKMGTSLIHHQLKPVEDNHDCIAIIEDGTLDGLKIEVLNFED